MHRARAYEHSRNIIQGVRQRARKRGLRAELALEAVDSPYDERGILRRLHLEYNGGKKDKKSIARDAAELFELRKVLIAAINEGRNASRIEFRPKNKRNASHNTEVTEQINYIIKNIYSPYLMPLNTDGTYSKYQYDGDQLATPYRLKRKSRAGIELVGIEPNPGPTHHGFQFANNFDFVATSHSTHGEELRALLEALLSPVEIVDSGTFGWDWLDHMLDTKVKAFRRYDNGAVHANPKLYTGTSFCCNPSFTYFVNAITTELSSTSFLLWTINDRRYFKIADHHGFSSLKIADFDQLLARYVQAKVVSHSSFERVVRALDPDLDTESINTLFALFGGTKGSRATAYFTAPVFIHTRDEVEEQEDAMPRHQDVVPALVENAVVLPADNPQNDAAAIVDRLFNIAVRDLDIPGQYLRYAREFAEALAPEELVRPIDPNDVVLAQRTAITRDRMIRAACHIDNPPERVPNVKAFVKNEAYPEPKDVRNISGVDPEHNMWGFTFDIPLKAAVYTRCASFFPGVTPEQLPDRLTDVMRRRQPPNGFEFGADYVGDYSRFDGRQAMHLRLLIFMIMQSWIHYDHRDEFASICNAQVHARCYTKTGLEYDSFGSMLSGAWCTTSSNTLLNMFVMFCGLRLMGIGARASKYHMGACFGDDSAFRDIVNAGDRNDRLSARITQAAAALGLALEVEERDGVPIDFLSRYYRFEGNEIVSSCPDVARLLPKLHVIPRRDVTLTDVIAKFSSVLLLCGDSTPILSAYLKSWFRLTGYRQALSTVDLPYWMTLTDDPLNVQFPPSDDELRDFVIQKLEEQQGIGLDQVERLDFAFANADSLEELYSYYACNKEHSPNVKFYVVGRFDDPSIPRHLTQPQPALNNYILRNGYIEVIGV